MTNEKGALGFLTTKRVADKDVELIEGVLRLSRGGLLEIVPVGYQLTPEEAAAVQRGESVKLQKGRDVLCEDMVVLLRDFLMKWKGKHVKIFVAEMTLGDTKGAGDP